MIRSSRIAGSKPRPPRRRMISGASQNIAIDEVPLKASMAQTKARRTRTSPLVCVFAWASWLKNG